MAAAAGLAVQDVIRRDGLLANVVAMGGHLQRRLEERFANHHHIGDIRGRGLFRGVELVADRGSKEPFAPEVKLNALVNQSLRVKILDVSRKDNKLIFSEKEAVKDDMQARFSELKVGDTVEGVVTVIGTSAGSVPAAAKALDGFALKADGSMYVMYV